MITCISTDHYIYILLHLQPDPTQVYNINMYINISKHQRRMKILLKNNAILILCCNYLGRVGHIKFVLIFFNTFNVTLNRIIF